MVDSRQKGATAETAVRDALRKLTGFKWERVPGSGALDPKHQLKGDLYCPSEKNLYVVEVKHYKDDHLTSSILTGKSPQLIEWWQQATRQGVQVDKEPLLIFKFDRSKLFCAFRDMPAADYRYMYINYAPYEFYISLLDDYIKYQKPKFIQ